MDLTNIDLAKLNKIVSYMSAPLYLEILPDRILNSYFVFTECLQCPYSFAMLNFNDKKTTYSIQHFPKKVWFIFFHV